MSTHSKFPTILLFLIAILIAVWAVSSYNNLVSQDESVSTAWSQVENVYQRRMDLIPNLVKTVEGAANFEKSTLTEVIEARSAASSIQLKADELTQDNMAAFQQAQDGLGKALSRLMVVVERYPELTATENFRELQQQLEGTENRISVERKKFNETVKLYNVNVRHFPKNIIAQLFGFESKSYFQAVEGADEAPTVEFAF